MRCSISSCKYYLHLACFQLPTQISSLPLLHKHDHSLVLQSGDKLKPWESSYCRLCKIYTSGLFYGCTKYEDFKVDIKCASMPDTIYHAAHPPHPLNLLSRVGTFTGGLNFYDGIIIIGMHAAAVISACTLNVRCCRHQPPALNWTSTTRCL